jgi:Flp pilus assembly protein TadG
MAIVLPLLLLIVFGIIDFGLLLNRQILLTEAAREGARAVALTGADEQAVRDLATDSLGITLTSVQITGCPAPPAAGEPLPVATVALTYRYQNRTPLGSVMLIFGSSAGDSLELHAKGAMACVG